MAESTKDPVRANITSTFTRSAVLPAAMDSVSRICEVQTFLRNYGYQGTIDGDWGKGTEVAFKNFVKKIQNSPEYEKMIADGVKTASGKPLTKDGLWGDCTLKALEAMAGDGRLGSDIGAAKRMVETIRLFKSGMLPMPAQTQHVSWTSSTNPAPGGGMIFWGDSIANGLALWVKDNGTAEIKSLFRGAQNLAKNSASIGGPTAPMNFDLVLKNARGKIVIIAEGTNAIMSLIGNENAIRNHAKTLGEHVEKITKAGGFPLVLNVLPATGDYIGWEPGSYNAWNKTVPTFNQYLKEELTALRLGKNFLETIDPKTKNQQIKIGEDHLHPAFKEQGFGALTNMILIKSKELTASSPALAR